MKNYNLNKNALYYTLYTIECLIIIFLVSFFIISVNGGTGTNVTITSSVTISVTYPEILNVEANSGSALTLTVNSTKIISCVGLLRDYNNETYFANATGVLFNSTYDGAEDKNNHYTNSTCQVSTSYGGSYKGIADDEYMGMINCTFVMEYYSNPGNWNCTLFVNNTYGLNTTNSSAFTVNELLGLSIPPTINFGTVDATTVSGENFTNVSNAGNVKINISLRGYATVPGDRWAMNCTKGSLKNISIMYEKYNLTESNPGVLSLTQFETLYTNLTNASVIKKFDLDYRRDDIENDATNATYWRIYIPTGVAGSCQGNIEFGSTKAAGSN